MSYDLIKLSNQICHPLYSAANALVRVYTPLLAEIGLTYPQYIVMMALWEQDRVNMTALSEATLFDSGSLTPLVKRLIEKGLIRQTVVKEDHRQKLIELTKKGEKLKDDAIKIPELLMCQMQLSLADLQSIKKLAEKLRNNLVARDKE